MKRLVFVAALVLGGCDVDVKADAPPPTLANVRSSAYVIQKQTEGDRIERLAKSNHGTASLAIAGETTEVVTLTPR